MRCCFFSLLAVLTIATSNSTDHDAAMEIMDVGQDKDTVAEIIETTSNELKNETNFVLRQVFQTKWDKLKYSTTEAAKVARKQAIELGKTIGKGLAILADNEEEVHALVSLLSRLAGDDGPFSEALIASKIVLEQSSTQLLMQSIRKQMNPGSTKPMPRYHRYNYQRHPFASNHFA